MKEFEYHIVMFRSQGTTEPEMDRWIGAADVVPVRCDEGFARLSIYRSIYVPTFMSSV